MFIVILPSLIFINWFLFLGSTNKYLGGIPLVKIQGGINVEEINFTDTHGIVEFTKGEKYCPNVKINNGTAKYGVSTEVPVDDNDFED